jgi:hypothetical protein
LKLNFIPKLPTKSNNMKTNLSNRIPKMFLAMTASVFLAAALARAADVAGSWTWTTPGRNGGPDRVSTLTLKAEDTKLTGKLSTPGRDGAAVETPVTDGKVDGDNVNFNVVREYNGNSTTNKYTGMVSVDKITGKIEFVRNGEAQSRDWTAKRVTETK